MDASVVIPCWIIDEGLLKLTERCIHTLRDTSDVEIIIIDNGSTIGQQFMKSEADYYIKNDVNKGYVAAVNQGLRDTDADYVVLTNNDIAFTDGWLDGLKALADNVPNCGAALPYMNDELISKDSIWEEALVGSCFLMKHETIKRVGLFDERFFNRYGDADYAIRLWEVGLKIFVTPDAHCLHAPSSSLSRLSDEENKQDQFKDMVQYVRKWRDHPKHGKMLRETIGNELCQSL